MKSIILLALTFTTNPAFAANSFLAPAPKAEALVSALVALGADPVGTHEYMQSGVTACNEIFDDTGEYFENGQAGDYIGEECLVYNEFYDSDPDGALRAQALIPVTDRNLERNPELREKMAKLRALRLSLEALVLPIVKVVKVDGKEVVASRMTGISGLACDGRSPNGERICYVKPSELCPPRN